MTAVEQYQQPSNGMATWSRPAAPAPVANRSVVSLTEWAEAARAAHEVSEILVRTPFVPEAYRDNPYAATAAILAGDEVGLSPMASLNAYDVIQGRAAPKAMTLRAIVQSRGHEVWIEESSDARCVVRGSRAGSTKVQESVWTIQRARTMKLAGKQQWQLQPQAMLLARATSECCRLVAADAILGIPYSSEELTDDVADAEQPAGAPAPQRTAQRRTAARPAVERAPTSAPGKTRASAGAATPAAADSTPPEGPPLPGEDGYDDEPPADEPPPPDSSTSKSSRAQNGMMHALFKEAEVDDRADRLELTGVILGRELTTSAGLTMADAGTVIDALERLKVSGHDGGLPGAVTDLLTAAEVARAERELAAEADAEQGQADDDARGDS